MTEHKEIRCPFCGSESTDKVSDFATALMVSSYHCGSCNSYFECIKWGEDTGKLDLPDFLKDTGST